MFDFFKKKIKVVTHNDRFHADDVFSVAVLQILYGKNNIKIIRTRDEEIIKQGDIVLDIGGVYDPDKNLFDHHEKEGAGERLNGIPYASFGLIWKKFGEQICGSKELAEQLDEKIVQPVDAMDNGVDIYKPIFENVHPYLFHNVIFSFHPIWTEERNFDKNFEKAVGFVGMVLEREIKVGKEILKAEKVIEKVYEETNDKRLVIFDENTSFGDEVNLSVVSKHTEPPIIVAKTLNNETWKAKVVPVKKKSNKNRIYFPESWRGLTNTELRKISGISDLTFCHRAGFLIVGKTKESVIEASKITIAQEPKKI